MRFILLVLLSCFVCACPDLVGPPDTVAKSPSDLPWAAATFLEPVATTLTFANHGDERIGFSPHLRDYFVDISLLFPDSLAVGEEVTVSVDLTSPIYLILRIGGLETMRVVVPGFPRVLAFDGIQLNEESSEQAVYDYLDTALTPINPVGYYPPEIDNVPAYRDTLIREFTAHLDSLQRPATVPEWAEALIRQDVELKLLHEPLHVRAYRRFFFADTLAVETVYMDSVARLLQRPAAYHAPTYLQLHHTLANYRAETGTRQEEEAATRNYWSYTEALLDGYPIPSKRDDATAAFLSRQIGTPYLFGGKAQIIDALTASLPPAYREKIAAFSEEVAKRNSSDEGLRAFLDTPLENGAGEISTPLDIRRQPKTLYKFWFAGCYPCLLQQPAERELLAAYPDLEIVYVAYATDKENWLPYLKEHDAPATANLYVPEGQTKLVRDALGQLGAPTYLLLDATGEVVCSSCLKPSDPAFKELLR